MCFIAIHLQVYVKVNQAAKTDESIFEAGKAYFCRMEQGCHTSLMMC